MLVLSRKSGERVLVGEDIEVVVLEAEKGRVKLGFIAPRCLPIVRAEIHQELAETLSAPAGIGFS
jgi:carbon storage regulator